MRNRVTTFRRMVFARLAHALLCAGVLVLVACAPLGSPVPAPVEPLSSELIQVEPWPEADALFLSNPRVLTYAINIAGYGQLVAHTDLYYP